MAHSSRCDQQTQKTTFQQNENYIKLRDYNHESEGRTIAQWSIGWHRGTSAGDIGTPRSPRGRDQKSHLGKWFLPFQPGPLCIFVDMESSSGPPAAPVCEALVRDLGRRACMTTQSGPVRAVLQCSLLSGPCHITSQLHSANGGPAGGACLLAVAIGESIGELPEDHLPVTNQSSRIKSAPHWAFSLGLVLYGTLRDLSWGKG